MITEYEPGHCPDSEKGECYADPPCAYGCDDNDRPSYDECRKALRRSLLRTHWILRHPSVTGSMMMAQVHGMTYKGPVWTDQPEIQEAFRFAGLPLDLPTPKYPEDEAGVFKKEYQEIAPGEFEHVWEGDPDPSKAVFLGTYTGCHKYMQESGLGPEQFYVTKTGRVIDNGEEQAFFSQFES